MTSCLLPKLTISPRVHLFVRGIHSGSLVFSIDILSMHLGVAPFPGAETGTGGRIRDTHATGMHWRRLSELNETKPEP